MEKVSLWEFLDSEIKRIKTTAPKNMAVKIELNSWLEEKEITNKSQLEIKKLN